METGAVVFAREAGPLPPQGGGTARRQPREWAGIRAVINIEAKAV